MDKLTPKQEQFCELIAKGETQNQAYKKVYGCKGSNNNTIYNNAYKLMNQDNIKRRLAELKQIAETDIKYTKEDSFNRLCEMQKQAEQNNDINSMVRIEEMKGKLFGLYNNKVSVKADIHNTHTLETLQAFKIVYSIDRETLEELIKGNKDNSNVKMILDDLKRTDTLLIDNNHLKMLKGQTDETSSIIDFSARLKEPETYVIAEDIEDRNC